MIAQALLCSSLLLLAGDAAAQAPAPAPSAITLTANATALNSNADIIAVSVSGVASPTIGDAIAWVQDASVSNYTAKPPQKFQWLVKSNSSSYMATGSGNVTFRILNTRLPFRFIFVTNISSWSNGSFSVLASTPAIPVANPNAPTQVRLASTNMTGQLVVAWTTANQTASPTVRYGTQPGVYTANVTATFDTLTKADMCSPSLATTQGWADPGVFNNALLSNLSASTKYYYVVGDSVAGFSSEFSFTTPPAPGTDASVQFFAIADLGYCDKDKSLVWEASYPNAITSTPPTTVAALKQQFRNILNGNWLSFCAGRMVAEAMANDSFPATLLVHNGDISYAQGFEYGWEIFGETMQPLTASMPFMVLEGNHERDWPGSGDRFLSTGTSRDSGGECGSATAKRYPMPWNNSQKRGWFSFSHGPVYFIQVSTELDFAPGSDQHNFVFKELSTVNRSTYPWLIVGVHRPYFEPSTYGSTLTGDINNQRDLQDAFDDLFLQYSVDMTLFGHTHWYSRSCPLYKKNCIAPDANGTNLAPVHVNIGNGGASFSQGVIDPALLAQNFYQAMAVQHGYARLNVSRTALNFQAINAANGQLIDQFTLTKPAGFAPNVTAQTAFQRNFLGNATLTWEETYSSSQVFVDTPALTAFLADNANIPTLQQLAATNVLADPVTGPTSFETYELALPFQQLVNSAFNKYVRNASDPTSIFYYDEVYGPLNAFRQNHPNGIFKGPYVQLAAAPAPSQPGVQPALLIKEQYDGPGAGANLSKALAPGVNVISIDEVDPNTAAVASGTVASLG